MRTTTSGSWDDYEWLSPSSALANRTPMTLWVLLTRVGSIVLLYYVSAVLMCLRNTQKWRLSILPVMVPLAFATVNQYALIGGNLSRVNLDLHFWVRSP